MPIIAHQRVIRNGQDAPPCKRATPATGGALLLAIRPGLPLVIHGLGLTESEGLASQYLAERLKPQLDALESAVRNGGAR